MSRRPCKLQAYRQFGRCQRIDDSGVKGTRVTSRSTLEPGSVWARSSELVLVPPPDRRPALEGGRPLVRIEAKRKFGCFEIKITSAIQPGATLPERTQANFCCVAFQSDRSVQRRDLPRTNPGVAVSRWRSRRREHRPGHLKGVNPPSHSGLSRPVFLMGLRLTFRRNP
jgi:hypothetical protein